MRPSKPVLAAVLSLALTSCAGQDFDTSRVADVAAGRTTRAEIESWFGKPYGERTFVSRRGGALRRYTYRYDPVYLDPAVENKLLVVWFDDHDVVVNYDFFGRNEDLPVY